VARTYRATIRCHDTVTLALIEPTLHYQTDVAPAGSEPDPNDVASGIWGVIGTAFRAASPTVCMVDALDVVEEVIPPDVAVGGTFAVNALGTLATANQFLSRGTCLGVNIHTATRSRSARGFVHLAGCLSSSYAGGQTLGGAYLTAAQAFAALLDNSFDLGVVLPTHVNPVVYSRTRRARGESPYTFQVTSATVSPVVRYLRSRDSTP